MSRRGGHPNCVHRAQLAVHLICSTYILAQIIILAGSGRVSIESVVLERLLSKNAFMCATDRIRVASGHPAYPPASKLAFPPAAVVSTVVTRSVANLVT